MALEKAFTMLQNACLYMHLGPRCTLSRIKIGGAVILLHLDLTSDFPSSCQRLVSSASDPTYFSLCESSICFFKTRRLYSEYSHFSYSCRSC